MKRNLLIQECFIEYHSTSSVIRLRYPETPTLDAYLLESGRASGDNSRAPEPY